MARKKTTFITIAVIVLVTMLVTNNFLFNGYDANWNSPSTLRLEPQKHLDESLRLGELVQKRLTDLQSREVCHSTRSLICHGYDRCGFGCRIHSVVMCLMVGYATQRTVVVTPPLSTWLKPIGTTCPGFNATDAPTWSEETSSANVVRYNRIKNSYHPKFYPPSIPVDLSEALDKFHGNAFLWWAGQVARHVIQPTSETQGYLEREAKRTGFSHPIVGIHVRRTDKLVSDAVYHHVEEYMKHVEAWFNDIELTYQVVERKVFVASDDPTVAPELESKYPNYTFLYSNNASLLAGVKDRYTDEGQLGIVHDIYMLSNCDFLVCTLSSNIYPDPETQAEVMNSLIRCKYYKEGCRWVDKLHNLQGHLEVCRFDSIPCPNHCTEMLSRLSIDDHLEFGCPKRIVICEFCNQEFPGDSYDLHAGNCQFEVVWCENKCGAKLERRFLNNHMRNECHKRTVKCPYCSKEFVYETLQTHQYQCPRYPVPCPNRCDPTKIPREEVDIHVQEQCPSATVPCSFKQAGCLHKCPRYSMDRHTVDSTKLHLELMCDHVKKQQDQITQLCNALYSVTQVTNGTFIWKITDYKHKLIESMYKNTELVSEPFYTTRYGYKMAASVFLNGNGSGEGKYLSVYIKLLHGEYDNILEWPFLLPIAFTIYDQNPDADKRENITESFMPDPTWKHFQKPVQDVDQLGFGYPKFVTHDVLKTRDYVKGDSIVIKVKIDNSHFIIP